MVDSTVRLFMVISVMGRRFLSFTFAFLLPYAAQCQSYDLGSGIGFLYSPATAAPTVPTPPGIPEGRIEATEDTQTTRLSSVAPLPSPPSATVKFSQIEQYDGGYSIWLANLCSQSYDSRVIISLGRILNAFPYPYLIGPYSDRYLGTLVKKKRSAWDVVSTILEIGGTGMLTAGLSGLLATKTTNEIVAGIGGGLKFGLPYISSAVKKESDYIQQSHILHSPLPPQVVLDPRDCRQGYFLGLRSNAPIIEEREILP